MKKHSSEEAFYDRMKQLAKVNKTIVKESTNRSLGTLIDYKKAPDGIIYGIIKENHNYYIKKGGTKTNPDVSDFAYIGGLSNITNYQYKSLSEADKQRNMIFNTIDESMVKVSKTGSKTTKKGLIKENFENENDEFIPNGSYTASNAGGYEIMLNNAGDAAKVRDAFGSENPVISDWLEIEYVPSSDGSEDSIPVIDPNGYNIPLNQVMRIGENSSPTLANEDAAGDEIEKAESMFNDLEAATSAAEVAPEMGTEEMPMDTEPTSDAEIGTDEIPAEGEPTPDTEIGTSEIPTEEMPTDGEPSIEGLGLDNEEMPVDDAENGETAPDGEEDKNITVKEIEKNIGKLTNKIRSTDLEPSQVKSYVNSLLASFDGKFDELEPEDKDEMILKIKKGTSDDENTEIEENTECSECGGFSNYVESRGYTKESIMECDAEELGNLVGGFATAHGDGENDGDIETVSAFVALMPKILDILRSEYGHDEYANKLEPEVASMEDSSEEDKEAKINELWGGFQSLGQGAASLAKSGMQAAGNVAKKGVQAIGQAAQKGVNATSNVMQKGAQVANQAGQAVKQAGQAVKQQYYKGEINPAVKNVETQAANLGKQIANLNSTLTKAGQQPINVKSILATIQNQLGAGKNASIGSKVQPVEEEIVDERATMYDMIKNAGKLAPQDKIEYNNLQSKLTQDGELSTQDQEKLEQLLSKTSVTENEKKPSAGLSAEKKSEVVKNAKAGKDIGEKGKSFDKIATKAAKEYGSKEAGEKVAAAAMWKNIKREGVEEAKPLTESERKLRNYIRQHVQEVKGIIKPKLNENAKSESLKKLDRLIEKQLKIQESLAPETWAKDETINELFDFQLKSKLSRLMPNDNQGIEKLFKSAFSTQSGVLDNIIQKTSTQEKLNILKQYAKSEKGRLKVGDNGKLSLEIS